MRGGSKGQVTMEIVVLFGFVAAALVATAVYLQRGVSGGVKSTADSVGTQFSTNREWDQVSVSATGENDEATITIGKGEGSVTVTATGVAGKVVSGQKSSFDQTLDKP